MTDYKVLGEQAFAKYPKVSYELVALTYGSLVAQIVSECENVDEANKQLEQIGRNIGIRLIDEFLARSGINSKCKDFTETCNVISKVFSLLFCCKRHIVFVYCIYYYYLSIGWL